MSRHKHLALAAAVLVLVGASTATHSVEAVRPLGTLPAEAATITDYYRQNVYDPADQKIGEIVDLLIEQDGQVPATMISVGGVLPPPKNAVPIPFTALQFT